MSDTTIERLREAARQRRRVMIHMRESSGRDYEREMEPYAIRDGYLYAFSYFRDEFRSVPIADIAEVEITSREFEPRREVEL